MIKSALETITHETPHPNPPAPPHTLTPTHAYRFLCTKRAISPW